MDSRFLFSFLRQNTFIASITTYGSSPPAARDEEFERLLIRVAPAAEQGRLADSLDELFSDLDAAVAALERVRAKLAQYRVSVLKAAVEGTLTADWRQQHPHTEPASELLKRILAERRRRWEEEQLREFEEKDQEPPEDWRAKYKEPAAPDASGLPTLPQGWCWCDLAQLKQFSLYGPRFSSDDYSLDGVFVLRTTDISDSGKVNHRTAPRLKLSADELAQYELQSGDVLFTRTGSIGRLAVFNDSIAAIAGAYLIQYRLAIPGELSWYLFRFFLSPSGQNALARNTAGVGRPNLNAPNIERIPIPLPPEEEIGEVLETIEDQLSVIEHLEADLETRLKSAQSLRQVILHHAFTGRLVPQDPNDEPASELLQRIATEREQRARATAANGNPAARRGGRKKNSTKDD